MATTLTNSIPPCPLLSSGPVARPQKFAEDVGNQVLTRHVCHGGMPFEFVEAPSESVGPQTSQLQECGGGALDTIPRNVLEDAVAPRKQCLENNEYTLRDIVQGDRGYDKSTAGSDKPFYKWIRTLHKRSIRRQGILGWEDGHSPFYADVDGTSSATGGSFHRRNSSSGSSFGFVTAVKSASMSITTASVLSRSRRNTLRSSRGQSRADRSSRASVGGARLSEDSYCSDRPTPMDPAVTERSLQRRRILEELISTEESYIGDVRFLINVCCSCLQIACHPAGY